MSNMKLEKYYLFVSIDMLYSILFDSSHTVKKQ